MITFAKQNISIPPNTLKLTITVQNWTFAYFKNGLYLDVQICQEDALPSTACSGNFVNSTYFTKQLDQYVSKNKKIKNYKNRFSFKRGLQTA